MLEDAINLIRETRLEKQLESLEDVYSSVAAAMNVDRQYVKDCVLSVIYSADKKENLNMAIKSISIVDNGIAIEPRYTLKYTMPDDCIPARNQTKDLINLTADELQILKNSISKVSTVKSDSIEDFATEFKELCRKYSITGELIAGSTYSYMNIGNHKIVDFSFGYYGVTIGERAVVASK